MSDSAVIEVSDMPAINAGLNATSAALLVTGYVFIRRRRVAAHRACMLAAFLASTAFLASYLVYHFNVGHVKFGGTGAVRFVYRLMLGTHVVLAVLVLPLALTTLYRAWRERFDRHMRIARWTLPIWLYVSVTGVVVYWMLYWLYPPGEASLTLVAPPP
jgi:putative membrane protein